MAPSLLPTRLKPSSVFSAVRMRAQTRKVISNHRRRGKNHQTQPVQPSLSRRLDVALQANKTNSTRAVAPKRFPFSDRVFNKVVPNTRTLVPSSPLFASVRETFCGLLASALGPLQVRFRSAPYFTFCLCFVSILSLNRGYCAVQQYGISCVLNKGLACPGRRWQADALRVAGLEGGRRLP